MAISVNYNNSSIYSGNDYSITLKTANAIMYTNVNVVQSNAKDISDTTATVADVVTGKYIYSCTNSLIQGGILDGNNDYY